MQADDAKHVTCTQLLDLNDDCLLEICRFLTISETFQLIGIIDSRIDAIAYRRIALIRSMHISMRDYPDYSSEQLQVIGSNLRSLHISAGYSMSTESVLRLLRPLCMAGIAGHLQHLTLNYIRFSAQYLNCLGCVAPQLRRLDVSFCQLTDDLLAALLQQCSDLCELRVLGNYMLCGDCLQAANMDTLRILQVEEHTKWTLNTAEFSARYPHVNITAYSEGRTTQKQYTPQTESA